jgi:release factor glutamine methyltransferase
MLRKSKERLKAHNVSSYAIDAELLMCYVMDISREQLLLQGKDLVLSAQQEKKLEDCLERRVAGEPIAYIIGYKEFWGMNFVVTPDTLIPRPDSEILVETALALSAQPQTILDLGTGSGCLLLSLLKEISGSMGVGVDISPKALEVAKKNAAKLGLERRAEFILSDWWERVPAQKFDLIVANPPYIPSENPVGLEKEVAKYEPSNALYGGEDGMASYRIIASQLRDFLATNGIAVLEFGYGQEEQVRAVFSEFEIVKVAQDLSGTARCIALR